MGGRCGRSRHCPLSGEPESPASTLPDGFPHGRALCPHCLRFVELGPEGRLVDHDTTDPGATESERARSRQWFNTHGW